MKIEDVIANRSGAAIRELLPGSGSGVCMGARAQGYAAKAVRTITGGVGGSGDCTGRLIALDLAVTITAEVARFGKVVEEAGSRVD